MSGVAWRLRQGVHVIPCSRKIDGRLAGRAVTAADARSAEQNRAAFGQRSSPCVRRQVSSQDGRRRAALRACAHHSVWLVGDGPEFCDGYAAGV